MFKKINMRQIYKIIDYEEMGVIKDGKALDDMLSERVIPGIEFLFENIIQELQVEGFNVQRVDPRKANCIIRVFRHEGYVYKDDIHWGYGAYSYIKTPEGMKAKNNCYIDYAKCEVTKWLFQDECFDLKPHFVDYYVKIS